MSLGGLETAVPGGGEVKFYRFTKKQPFVQSHGILVETSGDLVQHTLGRDALHSHVPRNVPCIVT